MRELTILIAAPGAGKTWLIAQTFEKAGWKSIEGLSWSWIKHAWEKDENAKFVIGCTPTELAAWDTKTRKIELRRLCVHRTDWELRAQCHPYITFTPKGA
jgi:Ni2+-binding GTPase involved in maturation of urease and hydrogenase